MRNELIQHLRNEDGHPVATVIGRKDEDGEVYVGYSKCNTKYDTFSKKRGIQIARGRAEKGFDMEKIPFFVRERYPEFAERCRKYFRVRT